MTRKESPKEGYPEGKEKTRAVIQSGSYKSDLFKSKSRNKLEVGS